MRIREAATADLAAISQLAGTLDSRGHTTHPEIAGQPPSPSRSRDWLAEQLKWPHVKVLVAEDSNGGVVGLIRAHVGPTPKSLVLKQMSIGSLHEIVVASESDFDMVARALLEGIHEWLAGQGIHQVRATIWDFQRDEVPVFESLGYSAFNQIFVRDDGTGPTNV